jgi:hypothetical protein
VAVVATIEALLGAVEKTPNGLHALLELAVELAAASGARIESPAARATLERVGGEVSKSAKVGKLARDLLEV